MRTSLTLLFAVTALTACGEKKAPASAGSTPTKASFTADIPEGSAAKAFAGKLLKTTVSDFNPTGSSEFVYTAMNFVGDGTWNAAGNLSLGGESVDCSEAGTWRIDAMDGDNAVMDWKTEKTNCPSRDAGIEQRVSMSISGEDYKISFR